MSTDYLSHLKTLQPSVEDQRKLHAEINQLANQTILLNVSAIAISGAMSVAALSRNIDPKIQFPEAIPLASIATLVILFSLFYAGFTYFKTIRFIASYLIYTRTSIWEQHYNECHKEFGRPHFLYSESRAIIFMVLGGFTFGTPWLLHPSPHLSVCEMPYGQLLITTFAAYSFGVILLGFFTNLHHSQESNQQHWQRFFGETKFVNKS